MFQARWPENTLDNFFFVFLVLRSFNKINKPLVKWFIDYGNRYDVHSNVAYIMTKL